MKEQLEQRIRRNWWVGSLFALIWVWDGVYWVAILLGLGMLLWNLILFGVIMYLERQSG